MTVIAIFYTPSFGRNTPLGALRERYLSGIEIRGQISDYCQSPDTRNGLRWHPNRHLLATESFSARAGPPLSETDFGLLNYGTPRYSGC